MVRLLTMVQNLNVVSVAFLFFLCRGEGESVFSFAVAEMWVGAGGDVDVGDEEGLMLTSSASRSL